MRPNHYIGNYIATGILSMSVIASYMSNITTIIYTDMFYVRNMKYLPILTVLKYKSITKSVSNSEWKMMAYIFDLYFWSK